MRELAEALATGLREQVLPALGSHAARAHAGGAQGGDVTFGMDAAAEAWLESHLREHAPEVALYSEDRGLVGPPDAEHVLIVDPVDGTRPALAGFESACVSVAAAPLGDGDPRMGDVEVGVVVEIKSGARFVAVRGEGVRSDAPVALSANEDLDRLFWVYGLRGRPARDTIEVLAELLDRSSVGGGTFDLGSATYDMTRVLTGQLDAYVEPGPRMIEEVPGMLEEFRRVGSGAVLNNAPYDVAAAALCLTEGGAVVTDAAGRPLHDRPLLGSGPEFQMSMLAAANAALHSQLVDEIDRGVARLRERRAI
ncbi:MAG TPA: inositol monophosphatase family protein [Solirubrobacteraceae bacterium]|nr:inositol monophosphatase family protein [Solirubrobacteraceae bacterium]